MALSDIELVQEFKDGSEQAFAELIERFQHRVYNTTLRMLGNREDALDTAQECFIKVYKNIKKFKGDSSFSTWLFRITTNACRDELRKRKRRLPVYTDINSDDENNTIQNISNGSNEPEKITISRDINESIQELVNQLPEDQKLVFILREFQDLSYQEIAEILDISMGSVKSRLSRARRSLRQDLNKIIKNGGLE
ncbi:MAG: sigma-70 family RNA polymerase sigma factor [Halanaerobiaceae bacterium]|nr:sigma-70 family RNA polymerase sigma factor [Halanaerobiaceae bacterium]